LIILIQLAAKGSERNTQFSIEGKARPLPGLTRSARMALLDCAP